jgi:hypothetical protein
MVKALLDLGVDVSLRCKMNGFYVGTAECFARAKGYPEIANAIGNSGSTKISTTVRNRSSTLGKLLSTKETISKFMCMGLCLEK